MPLKKTTCLLPCLAGLLLAVTLPPEALGWGVDGHRIVGLESLQWLDDDARGQVRNILGDLEESSFNAACSWPDEVRETPAWEWSEPLHFVNIPRSARHYDRQRDCPAGLCVTEAIIRYAGELGDPRLASEKRWQALAWLCHLVGDLHQPLHAGYRDDRGANLVFVEFEGREIDLHEFWDTAIVRSRLSADGAWQRPLDTANWPSPDHWSVPDVAAWTSESHQLVAASAYPPGRVIEPAFADQSWRLSREQWQKAGYRLAEILNAVLGRGQLTPRAD